MTDILHGIPRDREGLFTEFITFRTKDFDRWWNTPTVGGTHHKEPAPSPTADLVMALILANEENAQLRATLDQLNVSLKDVAQEIRDITQGDIHSLARISKLASEPQGTSGNDGG